MPNNTTQEEQEVLQALDCVESRNNSTLETLRDEVNLHTSRFGWPSDVEAAIIKYLEDLYGDEPEKFEGPNSNFYGPFHIEFAYRDKNTNRQRGTLWVMWSDDNKLDVMFESEGGQECSGIEATRRAMRERFLRQDTA